ncbi:MAG: DUF411 domain-containing protein [Caldimonas sp.]
MRPLRTLLTALAIATQVPAMAANIPVKLYKNPNCYCCDLYAKHLEENGFDVEIVNTTDMASLNQKRGIPENLEGCHTATVKSYVIEGLVPAKYVHQLLDEHRFIRGLSVPGMPMGAPGMPGAKMKPLNVYVLDASAPPKVFATF